MRWVRLRRTKVKVLGEKTSSLMRGMAAQEEHTHFLQGILTNDVKALKPGTFNYNLWLRPNGQPVGDMFVYRFEDHFLIDTDLPAEKLIGEFTRMKISLRVWFEDVTGDLEHVFVFGEGSGSFVEETLGLQLREGEFKDTGGLLVARNHIRIREEGYDLMGDLKGLKLPKEAEVSEEEFEDLRIDRCVPRTGKELREGFSPLEAGLLRYAISMTKGCYVGQEAVARVHYRGRTPRTLVRFSAEGVLTEGEAVLKEGKKVGVVTSVRSDGKVGLGYLLRSCLGEDLLTEGNVPVRVVPCEEES
jgi:folate-binding protein YgfZ